MKMLQTFTTGVNDIKAFNLKTMLVLFVLCLGVNNTV